MHHACDLAFLVVHSPHARLCVIGADVKLDSVLVCPRLDVREVKPVGVIAGEDIRAVGLDRLLEFLEHGCLALHKFDKVERCLKALPHKDFPVLLPLEREHEDGVFLRVYRLVSRNVSLDVNCQYLWLFIAVFRVLRDPRRFHGADARLCRDDASFCLTQGHGCYALINEVPPCEKDVILVDGFNHLPVSDDAAELGHCAWDVGNHLEHLNLAAFVDLLQSFNAEDFEHFIVFLNGKLCQFFLEAAHIMAFGRNDVEIGLERLINDADAPAII